MSDEGGRRDDEAELWAEFARTRRRDLRNALVERHLGLAHHIAQRLGGRDDDDLQQAALLALVGAVDRFDPRRGIPFSAFAGTTIEGAIKQHLERSRWPVGVPRRVRHLVRDVTVARAELEQRLGRSPTVDELATRLDVRNDEVLEALAAARTRSPSTVDHGPGSHQPAAHDVDDPIGHAIADRTESEALLAGLSAVERQVIELRFVDQLLQAEIAERVGVSQMQVSRIIRRCVERLRAGSGLP